MKNNFTKFNLDENIIKTLNQMGYESPTLTQEKVIPKLSQYKDIVVSSKTGSGKTASFAIPIIEKINIDDNNVQALVIVPTRELAIQVRDEIASIGRFKKAKCSAIFGKQPIKEQINELKQRVHVVVATPGRIIDHIGRGTIKLDKINFFIIDEADKMLNKGFVEDMEFIFENINTNACTGLFSATIGDEVNIIRNKYLKNSETIAIDYAEKTINKNIDEYIFEVEESKKLEATRDIIYSQSPGSAIIFCNTKDKVSKIFYKLKKDKFNIKQLHGDLSQEKRIYIMEEFKKSKFNILISTDLSSRGIHIDNVSMVINYDVPFDKENYIHRVGRTGRYTSHGKSITLVSSKEIKNILAIEDILGYKIKKLGMIEDKDILEGKIKFTQKSSNLRKIDKVKKDNKIDSEITKIYLNIGSKKKIRVLDIVGAFNNLDEIDSKDIGVIDVLDICSYVDVLNYKGSEILKKYKEISIKKKIVKLKKDNR